VARQQLEVDTATATGHAEPEGSGRPMRADARRKLRTPGGGRQGGLRTRCEAPDGGHCSPSGRRRGHALPPLPNRIDVVEAVYRTDVDNLVHTAEQVSTDLEPWPAVVSFLEAFVRYAQGKRTFLNELHEAFEKNPDLKPAVLDRIRQAMELVVGRAQRAGVMRTDVNGADLMQLVGPMCTNATLSEDQSRRLLNTILDGLHREA